MYILLQNESRANPNIHIENVNAGEHISLHLYSTILILTYFDTPLSHKENFNGISPPPSLSLFPTIWAGEWNVTISFAV